MKKFLELIGVVAAVGLPFFNIPLIILIVKRKSSQDISQAWVWGVWGCLVLMFPSSLLSTDIVLKAFGISNLALFSVVVFVVMRYRGKK